MQSTIMRLFLLSAVLLQAFAVTPNLFKELHPSNRRPFLRPNQGTVSQECKQELANLKKNTSKLYEDLQALDAFGKPQSGFLAGNFYWLGHYDECMNLTDYRYCWSSLQYPGTVTIVTGLCSPKSCSESDILNGFDSYRDMIKGLDKEVNLTYPVCTYQPHTPYSAGFFCTLCLIVVTSLIIIGSSLYQAYSDHASQQFAPTPTAPPPYTDPEEGSVHDSAHLIGASSNSVHVAALPQKRGAAFFGKFFRSYSLPTNLPKLLSTHAPADGIPCLNGIRVMSMLWVILCHVFTFASMYPGINPLTGYSWFTRFGFTAILNGFFSVDSFFFLSGLLVCYLTLKRMAKMGGKIPWLWFYFHRYWRLTPAVAMTMLLYTYIIPYFGDGPLAQAYSARPNCPKYWWTNLLYINNFYPTNMASECIGWVWYLANDMQFFIISPLFILPLFNFPVIGVVLISLSTAASMIVTGILSFVYSFPATTLDVQGLALSTGDYQSVVYVKPYCRIVPYLIGMLVGYFFYRYKTLPRRIHPLIVLCGWILASGIGFAAVYMVYPTISGPGHWGMAGNVLYQTFSKLMWTLYLSWVVFACHYGYGGWVNSILSYSIWVPLSRLTFAAYLLHPIVLILFLANQGHALYFSLTIFAFYFAGVSLITYAAAAIFTLSVEFPLGQIEKLFMPTAYR